MVGLRVAAVLAAEHGTCSDGFGLGWPGNYKLPDSAFSASTEYRPGGWRASADNARLYFEDDQDNKELERGVQMTETTSGYRLISAKQRK
ncbi:hypothetical protein OS493_029007 [Desmophyllum pertusum]|uniref:Uncharacterized protein n=1 Tax=Desmophyllum pertusum TaxID=174260 RepID=A0A9X0CP56_9CNID|nr:hypothetical protein OS493_029007 [Desmophyllum pertusum]